MSSRRNGRLVRAGRAFRPVRVFSGSEDGVSAVEFALFAPFLFFAAAAMLDLGLAAYERMEMDRLLRSGAQAAMADPGASHVRNVITAAAEDEFAPGAEFDLSVERYCACPIETDAPLACTSLCAGDAAPGIYYRMEGTRTYPGMLLPDFDLKAEAKVQVR